MRAGRGTGIHCSVLHIVLAASILAIRVGGSIESSESACVYAYAAAAIAYSLVLYACYARATHALEPTTPTIAAKEASSFNSPLFLQGVLTHLLTEGDKFLILILIPHSPSGVGAYAFASLARWSRES